MKGRLLIIAAESATPTSLLRLCAERFDVVRVDSAAQALSALEREPVDLVVTDLGALSPLGPQAVVELLGQVVELRRRRDEGEEAAAAASPAAIVPYVEFVKNAAAEATRRYLAALLERCQGNVSQAAREAGVERASFHRLLRRHGLAAHAFRRRNSAPVDPGGRDGGKPIQ